MVGCNATCLQFAGLCCLNNLQWIDAATLFLNIRFST